MSGPTLSFHFHPNSISYTVRKYNVLPGNLGRRQIGEKYDR